MSCINSKFLNFKTYREMYQEALFGYDYPSKMEDNWIIIAYITFVYSLPQGGKLDYQTRLLTQNTIQKVPHRH